MLPVLEKSAIYFLIIFFGWWLRKSGRISHDAARMVGIIIVNLTLPAALIRNAEAIIIGPQLPLLFGLGILSNMAGLAGGYLQNRGRIEPKTSAMMLMVSSYNVGAVLLPFVEMFFPGTGVAYLCMFDSGNAVMGLGLSYSIAKAVSSKSERLSLREILRTLCGSIPFVTYIVLFIMAFLKLSVPDFILNAAGVIGNANGFLAMLMIGLLLEFDLPAGQLKEALKVIAGRYGLNLALMLLVWFFPAGDAFMKMITMLCLSSPVAAASVVYILECGYKGELTGIVSTISIVISLALIILIILTFGLPFAAVA